MCSAKNKSSDDRDEQSHRACTPTGTVIVVVVIVCVVTVVVLSLPFQSELLLLGHQVPVVSSVK
jgi:hypothetical protein